MTVTNQSRPRPRLVVEMRSQWRPRVRYGDQVVKGSAPLVSVDVYAPNPLVDELRQADPKQYSASVEVFGVPPTLFNSGDLPLYAAAGIDVGLLNQLPWIARPAAARATGTELADILDRFGAATWETWEAAQQAFALDQGVSRYRRLVEDWGITDTNDRIRAHLPAGARIELPVNPDGMSW